MLVDGKWTDGDARRHVKGRFERVDSKFRGWITADGSSGFKAEPGRYHLYVAHNCPWAYRAMMYRKLKGLDGMISMSVAKIGRRPKSWEFTEAPEAVPDTVNGFTYLYEAYVKAKSDYTGSCTVPTLWDKETGTIVNNESSEIIRMFNSEFAEFTGPTPDYYPDELREEIDAINDVIYPNVNNGVYRCGFSKTQEAYEDAFDNLFNTLDELEARLSRQRYLVGDRLTEADWRLFSTLIRFDIVYYGLFKCNRQHIYEYPNLWNYTLELYQHPGIAGISEIEYLKAGYYAGIDPAAGIGIVPKGPELDFNQPHDRDRFPAARV
jgi:putative glutathione S-transferase